MATVSSDRIVELLGALNALQQDAPTPFSRSIAYEILFAQMNRADLVALCGVLAEGNAFGADAARAFAGVSS